MEKDMLEFARRVFALHAVTEEPERLGGGWTNSVFAAGGLVLRCTPDRESGRLRREAGLARRLPPEVGYPEMVDSGSTDGCDWMLCRRVCGTNLEDAWKTLSWDERAGALEQLWRAVKYVHGMDPDAVRPFVNDSLWYLTTLENALGEAEALRAGGILGAGQLEGVKGYLCRFEQVMKQAKCVPVHGDLTPANAMWQGGRIAALMDFECAALAPKEADLMMLLDTAYARGDLPAAAADPAAQRRFHSRMGALVEGEGASWELLLGYQAIKLVHHVYMDRNDGDFSEEHEALATLRALLRDGKGRFAPVMP